MSSEDCSCYTKIFLCMRKDFIGLTGVHFSECFLIHWQQKGSVMLYFDTSLSLADPFPINVIIQKLIKASLGADHA